MPDCEQSTSGSSSLDLAVEKGAQLVGALAGVAVSIVNPFAGAAAGFFTTEALQRLGTEVISRVGDRAAIRAGGAVVLIAEQAEARRNDGQNPRDDGFFDSEGPLRSASDELMEGVIRTAAEAYEERKLPFISNIYTSVAYDDRFAWPEAMYYLTLADRLIYRQFVALANFVESDQALTGRLEAILDREVDVPDQVDVELQALVNEGLLGPQIIDGGDASGHVRRRDLSTYQLSGLGQRFVSALKLDRMPEAEILEWIQGPPAKPA